METGVLKYERHEALTEGLPFVIYGPMSFDQIIVSGKYAFVDHRINEKNFSVPKKFKSKSFIEYKIARFFHFNCDVSSQAAAKLIKREGCIPAKPIELFLFGAIYPEIQLEFPIVAVGDENVTVPFLYINEEGRCVTAPLYAVEWSSLCRFLAFVK